MNTTGSTPVEDGRRDVTPLPDLVAAYIRHATRVSEQVKARSDPDFWAFTEVNERVEGNAEDAWDLMLAILRDTPDAALGYVSAGPLEDLVRIHGRVLVDSIEREARQDPKFWLALGGIWLDSDVLPAPILARIQRASGNRILILKPS